MKKDLLRAAVAACLGAGLLAAPALAQEPIIGEMRILPYSFCPQGWALADGALIAITQNEALYSLYGTTYGGDGVNTFALPDMRSRMAMGQGAGPGLTPRTQGQQLGAENVTLTQATMPAHSHDLRATADAPNSRGLQNASWGDFGTQFNAYNSGGPLDTQARTDAVTFAGASQAHNNIQPALALRHCVALFGIFPSPN